MCFFLNMVWWCVFFLNMVWWCVFVKKHNDSICVFFFLIWFGGVYLLKKIITILYVRFFLNVIWWCVFAKKA